MDVFQLLQIGDVHYPDEKTSPAPVDAKDRGFPTRLGMAIALSPLQIVCRFVAKLIEDSDPHIIAFMGDYTSRGDAVGLSDCLSYLRNIIPVSWLPKLSDHSSFLIGNHDISRAGTLTADQRFKAVNSALMSAGFPKAAESDPIVLNWTGTCSAVALFGLNSCIGCGETRYLPSVIKPSVATAIDALARGSATPNVLDEMLESIDTPLLDESALAKLLRGAAALPSGAVPLVCAHHNLLPQATPRIAPYAELLNGGAIRAGLLALDRPVVFLHGHIHSDPYETVRAPQYRNSNIISISAPLLSEGFNLIEIAFNADGVGLGVKVQPYRRQGGQVVKMPSLDIPLLGGGQGLLYASSDSRAMLDRVTRDRLFNAGDLARDLGWGADQAEAALRELLWIGMIIIENQDRPPHLWRVSRAI